MKNTTPDPAQPIGLVTIIPDFLPPPEQLVRKKKTAKLTKEQLINAILEGNINKQALSGVNLSRAILSKTDLSKANL